MSYYVAGGKSSWNSGSRLFMMSWKQWKKFWSTLVLSRCAHFWPKSRYQIGENRQNCQNSPKKVNLSSIQGCQNIIVQIAIIIFYIHTTLIYIAIPYKTNGNLRINSDSTLKRGKKLQKNAKMAKIQKLLKCSTFFLQDLQPGIGVLLFFFCFLVFFY